MDFIPCLLDKTITCHHFSRPQPLLRWWPSLLLPQSLETGVGAGWGREARSFECYKTGRVSLAFNARVLKFLRESAPWNEGFSYLQLCLHWQGDRGYNQPAKWQQLLTAGTQSWIFSSDLFYLRLYSNWLVNIFNSMVRPRFTNPHQVQYLRSPYTPSPKKKGRQEGWKRKGGKEGGKEG